MKLHYKIRVRELIAALQSGKYKQATSALRIDDGFCCLGVACDISGQGQWEYSLTKGYKYCGRARLLPPEVQEYFGFATSDGRISSGVSLDRLNDLCVSFFEIAYIISQELADENSTLFLHEN